MNVQMQQQRAYRKPISLHGWICFGGEMREITVKNISISGMLIQMSNKGLYFDGRRILDDVSLSESIDFFLPQLQLSGVAKIARMFITPNLQAFMGLEFQDLVLSLDKPHFNRKHCRVGITIPGRLFLNGDHYDFIEPRID